MDPLSVTGTLIAVLQLTGSVISICYDYRQGVASASREVIQISDSLNSLRDVLEAVLRLVETSRSSADQTSDLTTVESLAKDGGILQMCKDELERLKEKLEPEKGWRKVRASLIWPLKEGEMRRALEGLERYKSTMQLALSADQVTLSLTIRDDVENLSQMFQRYSTDQKRQDIYNWIAAPDPYVSHVVNRKKTLLHTGSWLLKSNVYEKWSQGPGSFLWLYGIPGSGKTVLCSTIIEQLVRYCEKMPRTAVVYFYFDFNDAAKREVTSLVRSFITQILAQSEVIPPTFLQFYNSHHQGGTKTISDGRLINAFRDLVLTFDNVYIVFDALDESSDCEDVLQFIHDVHGWGLPGIHLLATSRQIPEVEESLTDIVTSKICLQKVKENADILLYVVDKLENDKALSKFPPDIRKQIQYKLLDEEGGMFQWVVCQLDMFRRCMSVAAVRKTLAAGLPKNLDQTYDQILASIDEIHRKDVIKTLQALTATKEPLSLETAVDILAVNLDSTPPRFEPESRMFDPRSILSMCSSLVTSTKIYRRGFLGNKRQAITILKLAHASVADWITQMTPTEDTKYHFSRHSARQFMAKICLTYLLDPEFSTGIVKRPFDVYVSTYPMLHHAVTWAEYLQKEEGDPDDHLELQTRDIVRAFLRTSKLPNGGNFSFWVGMLIPGSQSAYILSTQPLYYAASFGLTEIVRIILETEKDLDIDALGGRAHSSALHVATYRNHPEVVKMLLEKGADPDLVNSHGESPLRWASINKSEEITKLLLDHGATRLQ